MFPFSSILVPYEWTNATGIRSIVKEQGSLPIKSSRTQVDSFLSGHKGCRRAHKPHINMTTDQWGCEQSEGILDGLAGFTRRQRWIDGRNDWKTSHSFKVLTRIIDEWEQFMEDRAEQMKGLYFGLVLEMKWGIKEEIITIYSWLPASHLTDSTVQWNTLQIVMLILRVRGSLRWK